MAEKHGWAGPLVWSLALEGKEDLQRFKAERSFLKARAKGLFMSGARKIRARTYFTGGDMNARISLYAWRISSSIHPRTGKGIM